MQVGLAVLLYCSVCLSALSSVVCVPLQDDEASPVLSRRNDSITLTQGWTPSPQGRGTIDIVWSCVLTISLCSWSTLCLNLPALGDSYWARSRRKLYMTALGILGPELVFQISFGQYHAARRSVRDFHTLGYSSWTMTHAWYAEMGGFFLHTSDCDPFPLNAAQLHYLVKEELLEFPTVTKKAIDDKNKAEAFIRTITVLQISWFVLNVIGRATQQLAVTTFELTTLGFIVCTFATCGCWLHKPMDVDTPIILNPNFTIAEVLTRQGDSAPQHWDKTPLDFVQDGVEFSWNLVWTYFIKMLKKLGLRFGPQRRPIERIPNDYIPEPPFRSFPIVFVVHLIYAAIHFAGWNFHFPSRIELILWRVAVSLTAGVIFLIWSVEIYAFRGSPYFSRLYEHLRKHTGSIQRLRKHLVWILGLPIWEQIHQIAERVRNFAGRGPIWKVPLRVLVPYYIGGSLYALARAYILWEAIFTLRALTSSAYETVDWSAILPHF